MSNALTSTIDVAQVTLYAFWAFFAGLIYWIRKEDRREGYPLESDNPRRIGATNNILIPTPKTFLLPHGGTYTAPNFQRDTRDISATRTANSKGSPLQPTGDAMASGVGPASYAERHDEPELTREGHLAIVPMRVATEYRHFAGPDPRGYTVVGGDGKAAGKVIDIWVDRSEMVPRYLEVELDGESGGERTTRLVPVPLSRVKRDSKSVQVLSIFARHFADVPGLRSPEQITLLEEERISAFYAGGRMYADSKRLGPLV
jgi:photosynthetic reaction center H subunit